MPPVPNKHTSNIFLPLIRSRQANVLPVRLFFDFSSASGYRVMTLNQTFYFKFAYNFIVALLAEVKSADRLP